MIKKDVIPIRTELSRELVERIAHIIGPASACAKALKFADCLCPNGASFNETKYKTIIVVPRSTPIPEG